MAGPDPRLSIDLVWELLGNSRDAKKRQVYAQILDPQYNIGAKRNHHPYNQLGLKQNNKPKYQAGVLGCGSEVKSFCEKYMGGCVLKYYAYYVAPKSKKYEDLRFIPKRLSLGVRRIKAALVAKTPVRLPLIYKKFRIRGKTYIVPQHYIGVVGYGTNSFLYIDPYPSFSKAKYAGKDTVFMGFLTYDTTDAAKPALVRSDGKTKVLGGP